MTEEEKALCAIKEKIGPFTYLRNECPGVYSAIAQRENDAFPQRLYLVSPDADMISDTARTYGAPISGCPDWLYYDMDILDSGKFIIQYEVLRYQLLHRLPTANDASLQTISVFGAEHHPDYFGKYPVPGITPWGYTVRHKAIDNGVYWLETDDCQEILAVCYPLYEELSQWALDLSVSISDRAPGLPVTMDYRFFLKNNSCIPLYELMQVRPHWLSSGTISKAAILDAITLDHPDYAALINAHMHP